MYRSAALIPMLWSLIAAESAINEDTSLSLSLFIAGVAFTGMVLWRIGKDRQQMIDRLKTLERDIKDMKERCERRYESLFRSLSDKGAKQ